MMQRLQNLMQFIKDNDENVILFLEKTQILSVLQQQMEYMYCKYEMNAKQTTDVAESDTLRNHYLQKMHNLSLFLRTENRILIKHFFLKNRYTCNTDFDKNLGCEHKQIRNLALRKRGILHHSVSSGTPNVQNLQNTAHFGNFLLAFF